jgi:hypothetical protein
METLIVVVVITIMNKAVFLIKTLIQVNMLNIIINIIQRDAIARVIFQCNTFVKIKDKWLLNNMKF